MRKTVLVIDDEPDILMTVRIALELEGFNVITASSGEEALPLLAEHDPDAILLDLRLPGIDGFAVLDRLPKQNPELPVIVLSAHASPDTIERALEMGCRDFITKPFDPDDLMAKVWAATGTEATR